MVNGISVSVFKWADSVLVPQSPGVYAFHNSDTHAIYIGATGNLHRRFMQWRDVVVHEIVRLRPDKKLRQELAIAPRSAWKFTVLLDGTGMTRKELLTVERFTIEKCSRLIGKRCLNERHYRGR